MLKLKFVLPLALIIGILATFGVSHYMDKQKTDLTAEKPVTRTVVVAQMQLAVGTRLSEEHLTTLEYPINLVPPGSFSLVSDLTDRVTRHDIFAGDVILDSKLALKGSSEGFSSVIPPGMRAMTVAVNVVSGVGGFILPRTRVDVLATLAGSGNRDESITRIVLENIEVMAVDQTTKSNDSEPVTVKSVTLLVTPEQAEVLALASTEGKLQLTLRNTSDQEASRTSGVNMRELINKREAPRPTVYRSAAPIVRTTRPEPVVAQPEPPEKVIQMLRSNQRSEVVLKEKEGDVQIQERKPK